MRKNNSDLITPLERKKLYEAAKELAGINTSFLGINLDSSLERISTRRYIILADFSMDSEFGGLTQLVLFVLGLASGLDGTLNRGH